MMLLIKLGRASTKEQTQTRVRELNLMSMELEPLTEKVAEELTSYADLGGVIRADVDSPNEAIKDYEKYEFVPFKKDYLDTVRNDLQRISALVTDGEQI